MLYLFMPVHISSLNSIASIRFIIFLLLPFLRCFDARAYNISLLELIVKILRHGIGFDFWEIVDIDAVQLSPPIVYAMLGHHYFFPWIQSLRITYFPLMAR